MPSKPGATDAKPSQPPAQAPPTTESIRFETPLRARPTSPNEPTIAQAEPIASQEPEEMTRVNTRAGELYRLEIWRGGVRQNVIPIFQKEVLVGRGSKSKPVDIPLTGDVEVSRRHLTIIADGAGNFWAVNEGKNPAMVDNYELPAGQRIAVTPGVPIGVCSYMLRIQPLD